VLVTYERPQMLRHTLACARAALAESAYEIVIGVNDANPQTRQVIEDAGISKVIYNTSNTSINLYKQVFALAQVEYNIEIDDDLHALPDHRLSAGAPGSRAGGSLAEWICQRAQRATPAAGRQQP
jgi:nitrogenase molybdenum-iron protein alpha/beta subunit